jgi:hypothetical protein
MCDIAAVITGLVSLMTGYMTYRNEKQQIEQAGGEQPTETPQVQEGKQALEVVSKGVAQHGTKAEQNDLDSFENDPTSQRRVDNLTQSLQDLAQRNEHFRAMLEAMPPRLPLLQQTMEGENLRNVKQEMMGKQGDHAQSMHAEKDIDGASQRIG